MTGVNANSAANNPINPPNNEAANPIAESQNAKHYQVRIENGQGKLYIGGRPCTVTVGNTPITDVDQLEKLVKVFDKTVAKKDIGASEVWYVTNQGVDIKDRTTGAVTGKLGVLDGQAGKVQKRFGSFITMVTTQTTSETRPPQRAANATDRAANEVLRNANPPREERQINTQAPRGSLLDLEIRPDEVPQERAFQPPFQPYPEDRPYPGFQPPPPPPPPPPYEGLRPPRQQAPVQEGMHSNVAPQETHHENAGADEIPKGTGSREYPVNLPQVPKAALHPAPELQQEEVQEEVQVNELPIQIVDQESAAQEFIAEEPLKEAKQPADEISPALQSFYDSAVPGEVPAPPPPPPPTYSHSTTHTDEPPPAPPLPPPISNPTESRQALMDEIRNPKTLKHVEPQPKAETTTSFLQSGVTSRRGAVETDLTQEEDEEESEVVSNQPKPALQPEKQTTVAQAKAPPEEPPPEDKSETAPKSAPNDLLDAIKKGKQLKSVKDRTLSEKPVAPPKDKNDLKNPFEGGFGNMRGLRPEEPKIIENDDFD